MMCLSRAATLIKAAQTSLLRKAQREPLDEAREEVEHTGRELNLPEGMLSGQGF